MFDLVIKNGMIVTAQGTTLGDLAVDGGKIVRIDAEIRDHAFRSVDAEGKYILPGLVEFRTHFTRAIEGRDAVKSLQEGTEAAIFGGVTTIMEEMDPRLDPGGPEQLLHAYRNLASGHCWTDYGFQIQLGPLDACSDRLLKHLVKEGLNSVGVSLCGPERLSAGELNRFFRNSLETGILACVHGENQEAIQRMAGMLRPEQREKPYYQAISRPNITEAQAVAQTLAAAAAAGDAPVYLQKISCREALEQMRIAKARGQRNIYVETCPHYLLLDSRSYLQEDGACYIVEPPLRSTADQQALWEAIGNGLIQGLCADHYSFSRKEKKNYDPEKPWDFRQCPPGLPGLEYRLDLLHHWGICQDKLSMEHLVNLCATSPAKLLGLFPAKGQLSEGADADILIYDGQARHRLGQRPGRSNFCPYEGQRVQGRLSKVFRRGRLILSQGQILESKPQGRYLQRGPAQLEL